MKKVIFVICVLLSSCYDNKKIYTTEEFLDDTALRKNYLKKCRKGELYKKEETCINVFKAEEMAIKIESYLDKMTKKDKRKKRGCTCTLEEYAEGVCCEVSK